MKTEFFFVTGKPNRALTLSLSLPPSSLFLSSPFLGKADAFLRENEGEKKERSNLSRSDTVALFNSNLNPTVILPTQPIGYSHEHCQNAPLELTTRLLRTVSIVLTNGSMV